MLGRYLLNLLIAIDRFLNAVLAGDPDETISGRMGRWHLMGGWRATIATPICWALDRMDPEHCVTSIEEDDHDRDLLDN